MNIHSRLLELADPKRAEGEKKYLKSALLHYGVTVPLLHKLARTLVKENIGLTISEVIRYTDKLWASNYHEQKWLAIDILTERRRDLSFSNLETIEHMVRTATGWALVDDLSAWLVGSLYEDSPKKMKKILQNWICDSNFWVRRTAILSMLIPLREGRGDFEFFEELTVPLLVEKEFFIRKAIGWVLRERAKKNPNDTYAYVCRHKEKMSGLTYREAIRRLPEHFRVKLEDCGKN